MRSLQYWMRPIVLVLLILLAISIQGYSQSDAGSDGGKENNKEATGGVTATIFLIFLIVAAVPSLIVAGNIYGAYHYYGERQKVLSNLLAKEDKMNKRETEWLIKEYTSMKPVGVEGVARAAMAIGLIVVVGVAVFFLLILAPKEDYSIVKEVLLILAGAISSIVGFYFGGRAGGHEEMPPSKEAEEAPAPKPPAKVERTDEVVRPEVESEK